MIFTATVDEIVYLSVPTPCFAPEVQGLNRAAHRYKKMREFMVLDVAGNEGIPVTLPDVRALLSDRAPKGLNEEQAAEVLAIDKANNQMLLTLNNVEDFDLPLVKPKASFVSETGGVFSSADKWGRERGCTPINICNCLLTGLLLT